MHSSKVGWAGQAFALATSSDTGGRKSRIRRSKEERKSMIETFIHKYQISNDGNFPSLNLTHKEVGGSFYTVREIVREIIQENRVLAPPKVSLEEHSLSEFMEQHPLGSISMEPLIDLSVSDRVAVVTHIVPGKVQFSSAENMATSNGSYPLEVNEEQTVSGGCRLGDKDGGSDGMSEIHHVPNHYQVVSNSPQSESHKFDETIVNGFEVVDGSPHSDKPLITSADHYDDIDKAKEFGQRIYTEPTAMETLARAKLEAQNVETSPAIKSHTNYEIVVETFPLRSVPRTVNNMSEESGKLREAAETLDDKGIQLDTNTFIQSSSSFASEKGDKELPHSTVELNDENRDEKAVLNLQVPSMENGKHPSASKPSVLDASDIPELKTMVSDVAKDSSTTETLIFEESTTVRGKSSDRENSSVAKGNNPTLDRINLETWDGAAKKSTQPETESNPLLVLVKAIISSFVKFWTE